MTMALVVLFALVIFLLSVDAGWSNVLSTQRNDLVFEGRNMAYGAYALRREQPRNMFLAILITSGLVCGGAGTWMWAANSTPLLVNRPFNEPEPMKIITVEIEKPAEKEKIFEHVKPKTEPKSAPASSGMENPEVEVVEDPVSEPVKSLDQLTDKKLGGFDLDADPGDIVEPVANTIKGGEGDGSEGSDTGTGIVEPWVDELPVFPGGDQALMKYMADRVHYSDYEVSRGVDGTLYMAFVVNADGTTSDIRAEQPLRNGERLEKSAGRAIEEMPRWTPGKKKGKAVAYRFRIPLKFKLKD